MDTSFPGESHPPLSAPALIGLRDALAQHPFLAGVSGNHLAVLSEFAMIVSLEGGQTVFRTGAPANRFYLVIEGEIVVESRQPGKEAVVIQQVGPGEVVGWSWLLPPHFWRFDARAVQPTRAIVLYGSRLRNECERDHHFGYELLKRMAQIVVKRLEASRKT